MVWRNTAEWLPDLKHQQQVTSNMDLQLEVSTRRGQLEVGSVMKGTDLYLTKRSE